MSKTPATTSADPRRDEQLRRSLLEHAHRLGGYAEGGWVSGSKLMIAARDDARVAVEDEAHAARLLDEMVEMRVLAEKQPQPTKGIGPRELRHRLFKLTDMGWQLRLAQIDPIPGIAGGDE